MKNPIWKITIFTITAAIIISFLPMQSVSALSDSEDPIYGDPLCYPGAYMQTGLDCLPLGPSTVITEMFARGIEYPFLPLNASFVDESLGELDYNIAKVNVFPPDQVKLFSSLDEAVAGTNPMNYLPAGQLIYISYNERADIEGGHYLLSTSGAWLRASPATYLSFKGLIFTEEPSTSFGWIVERTQPKRYPDYNAANSQEWVEREQVVQIFDKVSSGALTYYMIGINEWVERRYIRELDYKPEAPEGVDNNRWIEINLYEQTMSVYDNGNLVFATLIASGVDPYFTRPGLFQITEKKPTETMSGAFAADKSDYYYLENVPWTMYFDKSRAIHGAYWRAWFGYPQSHGCVNMSVADSHWVYEWANVGDWVYVWDPSGETPTDPSLYTDGGA